MTDKYGDISLIYSLSSLEVAAINNQRKRCYSNKARELEKELKVWLYQQESKENDQFDDDDEQDIDIDKQVNKYKDTKLDKKELKSQLREFITNHHNGYDFFKGAHCQPTVENFGRQYMHLVMEMNEIQRLLMEQVNIKRQRIYSIRNMSKDEMYKDFYSSSWMDGRFGGDGW